MNPSPPAVAAIRDRVAAVSSWAKADAAVLADLQADLVANPAAQGTVPAPFAASDLIAACSAPNQANLRAALDGAAAALIVVQDAYHLGQGLDGYQGLGLLSAADVAAMKTILARTMPDPTWPATVPRIQITLGRAIDGFDVSLSRPGV